MLALLITNNKSFSSVEDLIFRNSKDVDVYNKYILNNSREQIYGGYIDILSAYA